MAKKCTKCDLLKEDDLFRWRDKSKGWRSCWCKKCFSDYERSNWVSSEHRRNSTVERSFRYYNRNRQYVWDYLMANPCSACGERNPVVLEFHHLRQCDKLSELSNMLKGSSLSRIQEEIDKCVVLCANCHKIETAKQLKYYEYVDTGMFNPFGVGSLISD